MAAGRGERMRPLTDSSAKAVIPLAGRLMVEWVARGVASTGASELGIGLGWLLNLTKTSLSAIEWPVPTTLVDVPDYEHGPLETLVTTVEALEASDVLVTPVDAILSPADLSGLAGCHKGGLTLAIDCTTSKGSRVFLDGKGFVAGVGEEIRRSVRECSSAMAFAAGSDFLRRFANARSSGETRVVGVINEAIREGVQVGASPVRSRWFDIDTVSTLLSANSYLLSQHLEQFRGHVLVPAGDTLEVGHDIQTESGIFMGKGLHLRGPVLVAPDCRLGCDAKIGPEVFLANGVRVGAGARISKAMALEGSEVAHGVSLTDAVVTRSGVLQGGG